MYAQRARQLLAQMLNDPEAQFRAGQLECIVDCVRQHRRLLLVQKTGWGKSFVYFIATKLLRQEGAGPTLLVSPLLSLMRNQMAMAARIGIRADNLDSTNQPEWPRLIEQLRHDACDILFVSPERLGNQEFQAGVLPAIPRGIGLFVVDEAHCISDWGHDFRPDYRRIRDFIRHAPPPVPVLATTATANERVVADIVAQLGLELKVVRGPLIRESLRLQIIKLPSCADRLAWLAQYVPALPGSGIIYCLTKHDCEQVSEWLAENEICAPAYHSSLLEDEAENNVLRSEREEMLQRNAVKALVATVALGMGYDKPDLGFVIHFQRPGSIVAYYQQIGRAGRGIDNAIVVLLHGAEDNEIIEFFIDSAFPAAAAVDEIVAALARNPAGMTIPELLNQVNQSPTRIERCLRYLEVDGIVARTGPRYGLRPGARPNLDLRRQALVTDQRFRELAMMREFCTHAGCSMEFIARALDDATARPCGRCAHCSGAIVSTQIDPELRKQAVDFLKGSEYIILPRQRWPARGVTHWDCGTIKPELQLEPGRALSLYLDAGWGHSVHDGKYRDLRFSDDLVQAAAELICARWRPTPYPKWLTAVPSLRHPQLVPNLAERLAARLRIPYRPALIKTRPTAEQKLMQNRMQQVRNLAGAFVVLREQMLPGGVLLVDDIVDSRWTMTYTGALLRAAGAPRVFPFALALASHGFGGS